MGLSGRSIGWCLVRLSAVLCLFSYVVACASSVSSKDSPEADLSTVRLSPKLAAAVPSAWWQPTAAEHLRWYWQLQDPIDLSHDVDVYNIDINTPQQTIDRLKARGVKLICYFSVGTVEDFRDDASLFPQHVTGARHSGYSDERWLDISRYQSFAVIMQARLDLCSAKGFDGVEGDNVDAFNQPDGTGFGITQQHSVEYILWLAHQSHQRGLGFGLKNAESVAESVLATVDWMITENCFVDDWCSDASSFIAANKPVFMTEYIEELQEPEFKVACEQARLSGYSAILRDTGLTANGVFKECL